MYAFKNNCEVEIFTKPKPVTGDATFMDRDGEKGKGKTCDEEVDSLSESDE